MHGGGWTGVYIGVRAFAVTVLMHVQMPEHECVAVECPRHACGRV